MAYRDYLPLLFYGFSAMMIFAGIDSLTDGFLGIIAGVIWILTGAFAFGPVRRLISIPLGDEDSRPQLESLSKAVVVPIVVIGFLVGVGIAPSTPTETPSEPVGNPTPTPTVELTTTVASEPPQTQTATATTTARPTTTAQTTTPAGPPIEWTVEVVEVIDGDTMEVRYPNGSVDTIRLLGVDTPETSVTQVSPDEWENFPDTVDGRDWLVNWGERASGYAEDRLAGREIHIEIDPEADRRGYYGRLLVYAFQSETSETSFNERLLTNGYARYYDSTFTKQDTYQQLESTAQDTSTGVWGYTVATTTESSTEGSSPGELEVWDVHADADGNDHDNLNDEYIVLRNTGESSLDMGGWTVSDEAGHTYTVPRGFELETDETVTIYSGSGSDSGSELYWGSGSAVWNNGGDTIVVEDVDGTTVVNYSYSV